MGIRNGMVIVFCLLAVGLEAQTQPIAVDEIVRQHIAALGGLDNLRAAQTMKLTGQYNYNGMEYPLTVYKKRPDLYRFEIDVNGKKVVLGFDGETAWEINEFQSPQAKAIQDARSRRFVEASADFEGAIVNYRQKGHDLTLLGKAEMDGNETYHLQVNLQNGQIEHWFIDVSTFTVLKRTAQIVRNDGDQQTQVLYYLDYKPVDGILIPHYIEREDVQHVREQVFDAVEINSNLDNILFKPL